MNPTPDMLPITGVPWLDALVKIAGAIGIIGSLLANVLPKDWATTSVLTRLFADGRKVQHANGEQVGIAKSSKLPPLRPPPNMDGPE